MCLCEKERKTERKGRRDADFEACTQCGKLMFKRRK